MYCILKHMDRKVKSTNRHINQTAKDMLGRLLASEDINIVHDPSAHTATFHTETRTLTLPDWSYMSSDVYDLLVGHEVGHALFTPDLGKKGMVALLESISKNPTLAMTYLNIAEDVRIEKKIQNKFPGLRKNFTRGYVQMVKEDFFQTAGKDLTTLRFADRVNIHSKAGSSMGVQFDAEETRVLRQVESAVSFDDTVEAAKAMLALAREQNKQDQSEESDDSEESVPSPDGEQPEGFDDSETGESSQPSSTDPSLEEEENQNGSVSGEPGDEESEDKSKKSDNSDSMDDDTDDGEGADSETGEDGEETTDQSFGHDGGDPETSSDSDLMPQTQDAFDSALESSAENNKPSGTTVYATCPDVDLDQVIVDHKVLNDLLTKHYSSQTNGDAYAHAAKLVKDFNQSTTKVVNLMAKRFDMKKAADAHKRTMSGKTGVLNIAKLHEYRFTEDLFLRTNTTHDGKNHGIVLFIDWSGSMCSCLANTIRQLMTLTAFCRKVGIPFEVYAFSDRFAGHSNFSSAQKAQHPVLSQATDPNPNIKDGDMRVSSRFRLLNLLSSRMKGTENKKAMQHLMLIADYYENCYCSRSFSGSVTFNEARFMTLGCTPLDDTIVVANTILPKFRKDNRLQVVNVCFLTDGASGNGPLDRIHKAKPLGNQSTWYPSEVLLRSNRTKRVFSPSHYEGRYMAKTCALLDHLGDNTGANVIGYSLAMKLRDMTYLVSDRMDAKHLWKSVCKDGAAVSGLAGYDEHYVLDSRIDSTEEDDSLNHATTTMTKRQLSKSFAKSRKTHLGSKVVAQKFVDLVCKEN